MSSQPSNPSTSFATARAEWQELLPRLHALETTIQQAANLLVDRLRSSGKILTCGNGGSAADALHLAEELVGRYRDERRSLPGICLNSDPTALTCIANDYGFDAVFSRSLSSLGGPGDVLVTFSTSGNSANVLKALEQARSQKIHTISLLGKDGGKARDLSDLAIVVPSENTARIQEVHTLILHSWLEFIESQISAGLL